MSHMEKAASDLEESFAIKGAITEFKKPYNTKKKTPMKPPPWSKRLPNGVL